MFKVRWTIKSEDRNTHKQHSTVVQAVPEGMTLLGLPVPQFLCLEREWRE